MKVILSSGVFLSFFIVILLLTKKPKSLTDKILAVWMAIIGLHILNFYFNKQGYWETYPHLVGVTAPLPFLHGVMLYLYTLYSLRKDQKIRRIDYLHFAPALLAYVYMFPFFFFYSPEEKKMLDRGETEEYVVFSIVLLIAMLISGILYAVISYKLTIKHKRKLENNFSFKEGINIKWLRYCIISIGLVFITATIISIVPATPGARFSVYADYIIYIILVGLVFYIGYNGIRQENIFTTQGANGSIKPEEHEKDGKYKNSGMSDDLVAGFYEKLLKKMDQEKPYLDPRLSLSGLAQLLEISPNQLSQTINQKADVNFHDFVNSYRVEEFIQRAHKNSNYSLLALALDSGFNSKSSFNNIFKKQTGLSPSKYLSNESLKTTGS